MSFQIFHFIFQNFVYFSEVLMGVATGSKIWKSFYRNLRKYWWKMSVIVTSFSNDERHTSYNAIKTLHHRHFNWISPQISQQLFERTPFKELLQFYKKRTRCFTLFYYRGMYIERYIKEASDWNEYQENTLRIGFQFQSL